MVRIIKEGTAKKARKMKGSGVKSIIGMLIGIAAVILLGFLFISIESFIPSDRVLMYWLMVCIGGILANIFLVGFIMGNADEAISELKTDDCLLGYFMMNIFTFGVEGLIITILFGGLWWIFSIGCGLAGLFLGTAAEDDFWAIGLIFFLFSSYILGLIFGGSLAIIALILVISTFVTLMVTLVLSKK